MSKRKRAPRTRRKGVDRGPRTPPCPDSTDLIVEIEADAARPLTDEEKAHFDSLWRGMVMRFFALACAHAEPFLIPEPIGGHLDHETSELVELIGVLRRKVLGASENEPKDGLAVEYAQSIKMVLDRVSALRIWVADRRRGRVGRPRSLSVDAGVGFVFALETAPVPLDREVAVNVVLRAAIAGGLEGIGLRALKKDLKALRLPDLARRLAMSTEALVRKITRGDIVLERGPDPVLDAVDTDRLEVALNGAHEAAWRGDHDAAARLQREAAALRIKGGLADDDYTRLLLDLADDHDLRKRTPIDAWFDAAAPEGRAGAAGPRGRGSRPRGRPGGRGAR